MVEVEAVGAVARLAGAGVAAVAVGADVLSVVGLRLVLLRLDGHAVVRGVARSGEHHGVGGRCERAAEVEVLALLLGVGGVVAGDVVGTVLDEDLVALRPEELALGVHGGLSGAVGALRLGGVGEHGHVAAGRGVVHLRALAQEVVVCAAGEA